MGLELWVAVLGAAVVLPAVFVYNRLVADRNLALQGRADIDVQLRRRADLVPQLVEAVRGYAAYEKAVLTAVTQARNLKSELLALEERYPELKANANFLSLSRQLVEVEDHLQYARRFYNGAVQRYVTRIESFPDLVVARLFRFQPLPYFETDEREAPEVKW